MYEFNKQFRTQYLMYEDLTRRRSELAYNARWLKKQELIQDTWTFDGKIFMKLADNKTILCTRPAQFPFQEKLPMNNPNKTVSKKTANQPIYSYAKAVKSGANSPVPEDGQKTSDPDVSPVQTQQTNESTTAETPMDLPDTQPGANNDVVVVSGVIVGSAVKRPDVTQNGD